MTPNSNATTVSKQGYYARMILYAAIAFLTPIGAVLAAGKPITPADYVAAAIATLVALRAYIDKSPAQVVPNDSTPTVVVSAAPVVPPTP